MKPLQLLSAELLRSEQKTSLVVPFAVMIAGFLVAIALFMVAQLMLTTQQQQKDKLNDRIASESYLQRVQFTYQQTEDAYNRVNAFKDIPINNNQQLVDFIEELEKKMPKKFKALSVAASNDSIQIAVNCSSKEEAATITQNLRTFDTITVIAMSGIVESEEDLNLKLQEGEPGYMTDDEREEAKLNGTYVPNIEKTLSFTLQCKYADVKAEK